MKKLILLLACLSSASAIADTYTTYKPVVEPTIGFAKSVVQYNPGEGASGVGAVTNKILGAPDDPNTGANAPFNFLSMGMGGNVIVEMDSPLRADSTSANELYVFESRSYETFDVYVSVDQTTWTKLAITSSAIQNGAGSWVGFNLDGQVTQGVLYPYVRIVDTGKQGSTVAGTYGADIDAVVATAASPSQASYKFIDTDSRNGKVYDLYQNTATGAIGVKIIDKNDQVSYIPFTSDGSMDALAISLQGDFNCDDQKDINVLATRKADNVQLNIIKQQDGTAIKTIDNSVTR
ncbi:hypothetical protein [Erwinia oleae]|uniref:hypothetical protein n=1 Tax=Erwinia oleae TaxID=796334 RepID=UPI00054FC4EA|nr:hypothetical protein [Erwinia oleae]